MRKLPASRTSQPAQPTVRPLAEASLRQVRGGGDPDNGQLARRALGMNEPNLGGQQNG